MNDMTEVASENQLRTLPRAETSTSALVLDGNSLDKMMRLADVMATGRATMPKHFNGNAADCLAVIMQAMQWQMNPFAVAQKTHLVNGVLGYEAQLVNAVITACAPVRDRLHYEWFGDWGKVIGKFIIKNGDKGEYRQPGWKMADEEGLGVKVWATFRGENKPRVLELLLSQARTRNSTLWADDPRQQLAYLATKRWARLYCPDVILGVYSPDELEAPNARDMGSADVVQPPKPAEKQADAPPLPSYSDDEFAVKLAEWKSLIEAGRADAERIIKMSASRVILTDEQKKAIRDLEVIDV